MYVEASPNDYHVLHPRPVYLIVSEGKDGRLNVMSASWVSPIYDDPLLIAVSIWRGSLTHRNIMETGELTINVLGENHVELAWKAGSESGAEVDKFKLLNLKPTPSKYISTPGLEGVLGFVECVVKEKIPVEESTLFICESKAIHVDESVYEKYGWNLSKAKILLHLAGRSFTTTGNLIRASK
ncbi:MAG: flavin reductase family protein [Thermosphaera sp.]